MNLVSTHPLAPPRFVSSPSLLIFGLNQRYQHSNAGIPSQWDRFLPHFGHIPSQVGRVAYGVVYNIDEANSFDYLCGVQVPAFPAHPVDFTRLEVPPQTYAVFEHRDHISAIQSTWTQIWEHALKAAGCSTTDGPFFERYGEQFDSTTGLGGVELWIPIAPRNA